ncbi:MAG: hypothetical protein HOJ38_00395 [Rhodobiaceae bacterium]|jgi:hypothetical protein|nr:hypothetical protein [Rhodobiaceae bacterium]|tara:strand:+ start:85 stop:522 length:438 start_codon:yes stop_codon:yes gene_type:complete
MGDPWKSISAEGVRAFSYGAYSVILVWLWSEGYLLFINNLLVSLGISSLLAKSIVVSTVISVLITTVLYGLHGRMPTTLMLQHMTWVKNPDKFLLFFYIWINFISAALLNVMGLNTFYQFMSLFVIFLTPSLILGISIQKKGGNI